MSKGRPMRVVESACVCEWEWTWCLQFGECQTLACKWWGIPLVRRSVRDLCPEAFRRLDHFTWEVVRREWVDDELIDRTIDVWEQQGRDPRLVGALRKERENGVGAGELFVRVNRKPVSCDKGVNEEGLLDACREAASATQGEIHRLIPRVEDKALGRTLNLARSSYLNPLKYLYGQKRAKEVEAEASPDGVARFVCVGGWDPVLGSYGGCGRVWPDPVFGNGRRWPTWCKPCRDNSKSDELDKAMRRHAERQANAVVPRNRVEPVGPAIPLYDRITFAYKNKDGERVEIDMSRHFVSFGIVDMPNEAPENIGRRSKPRK